jgi:hypothetical protein
VTVARCPPEPPSLTVFDAGRRVEVRAGDRDRRARSAELGERRDRRAETVKLLADVTLPFAFDT